MADYPQNVVEFRDWFATESACREYLARLRWPQGLCCQDCASTAVWPMKTPFSTDLWNKRWLLNPYEVRT